MKTSRTLAPVEVSGSDAAGPDVPARLREPLRG